MENKRNYYRILNVQPDAPAEIIRASYRTLLRELKKHPDLGGDSFNAAVINEAYEILSDGLKRAEYDKGLMGSFMNNGMSRRITDSNNKRGISTALQVHAGQALATEPVPLVHGTKESYDENMTKINDRRAVQRTKKNGMIHYDVSFLQTDLEAEIQDLSPQGISFISSHKLMSNLTVKIKSPLFKGLAQIIRSEIGQFNGHEIFSTGARFLSVKFNNPKGSFYSRVIDEAYV